MSRDTGYRSTCLAADRAGVFCSFPDCVLEPAEVPSRVEVYARTVTRAVLMDPILGFETFDQFLFLVFREIRLGL